MEVCIKEINFLFFSFSCENFKILFEMLISFLLVSFGSARTYLNFEEIYYDKQPIEA